VTGFIADGVDELVAALSEIERLSRERCRREFETRFTVDVMVDCYERIYRQLIEEAQRKHLDKPKRQTRGLELTKLHREHATLVLPEDRGEGV
jgi:hypothetical protein